MIVVFVLIRASNMPVSGGRKHGNEKRGRQEGGVLAERWRRRQGRAGGSGLGHSDPGDGLADVCLNSRVRWRRRQWPCWPALRCRGIGGGAEDTHRGCDGPHSPGTRAWFRSVIPVGIASAPVSVGREGVRPGPEVASWPTALPAEPTMELSTPAVGQRQAVPNMVPAGPLTDCRAAGRDRRRNDRPGPRIARPDACPGPCPGRHRPGRSAPRPAAHRLHCFACTSPARGRAVRCPWGPVRSFLAYCTSVGDCARGRSAGQGECLPDPSLPARCCFACGPALYAGNKAFLVPEGGFGVNGRITVRKDVGK